MPFLLQISQSFLGVGEPPKALSLGKRKLKGCALDVIEGDDEVVGVEEGLFGRASEKIVRMRDNELVEGRSASHEHCYRGVCPASGSSPRTSRWRRLRSIWRRSDGR
jgi:formate dehydrogenase maturation protein FdhE